MEKGNAVVKDRVVGNVERGKDGGKNPSALLPLLAASRDPR